MILGEDRVGWDDVREHGGGHGLDGAHELDGARGQDGGHELDGAHELRGEWVVFSYLVIRLH